MRETLLILLLLPFTLTFLNAQDDDLLSLIEEPEEFEYVTAAFKSTRVVNGHSIENVHRGVMDFRISHRFGFINSGIYDLFGLDNATIRLGVDYGISDRLMIGFGRSSFEKIYDGFLKFKLLRQKTGSKNTPFTISYMGSAEVTTLKDEEELEEFFSSRWFFANQILMGRKFSNSFSFQLMPTHVHRNLVETKEEKNDVFSLGAAVRQKISNRIAITGEYYYVFPNQIKDEYYNSIAIGIDIETGGHVFQLHFTNSTAMVYKGLIAETSGNFWDGDIHFGFNISRVFTIVKPKPPAP